MKKVKAFLSLLLIAMIFLMNSSFSYAKDGPDILKSIQLGTQADNYYIGDKLVFDIESTEEISSANIYFYNPVSLNGHEYGSFYVYLTPSGSYDGTKRSFSGYIPKTVAGYYSSEDTGRTESSIYPGIYELSSIFVYNKSGQLIRYTTDGSFAEDGDFLYINSDLKIDLKEPTADELNDVEFVLKKLSLEPQSIAIGGKGSLDIEYTYDNSNKIVKSFYLVFRGSDGNKMFTTYVKSLSSNPYFMVASSADTATYKLDSVGVTFESSDGVNNTIIINRTTGSGRYAEIFDQVLTVTASESANNGPLYFSADELNEEVYRRIQETEEEDVIIDADSYTIIPSELFKLIKENTKRLIIKYNGNEWIFKGEDIKVAKNIDVLMQFYVANASNISESMKNVLAGEAVVLEFPNNEQLPGDVLIRIKGEEIVSKLSGDKYYVYYVDADNDKLNKVAMDVQKSDDDFIEFYVNHNSKYLITSAEITDQAILGKNDALFEKNGSLGGVVEKTVGGTDHVLLCSLIAVGGVLIVSVVFIMIAKKRSNAQGDSPVDDGDPTKEQ